MASRPPASGARDVAAHVLSRVWADDAYAAAALDAELRRRADFDPRDAALATELVYGVLRTQTSLEATLAELARKKTYARDPWVRAHLLAATYTLLFLDRVPRFAAVDEAVRGIAERADERVVGFANAVLRKLADRMEKRAAPLDRTEAIVASAAPWLRGELRRALGRPGAAAYLAADAVAPPLGISVAKGEDVDRWVGELQRAASGATVERGRVAPRAITVRGAGDVRRLPGAGATWIIQEEGAQVVALALGARSGERVLDACAGRGNKVWGIGQEVAPEGAVDAADLHPSKLEALRAGPAGALVRSTFVVDWTAGTGSVPEGYNRVLVDAPCSGVGTLRRRPGIGIRREPSDLDALRALQVSITRHAATRVKSGGRLLYAVCSVLRAEAEDVVQALTGAPLDDGRVLEPVPFDAEPAKALAGPDATTLRLLPHVHGTDGYFVASFVVRPR